jgi:hypothetical protein
VLSPNIIEKNAPRRKRVAVAGSNAIAQFGGADKLA